MFTCIALSLLASLASAAPILHSRALFEKTGAHATVYYDLTDSLCGNNDPFPTNWAVTSGINGGIPKCEQWAHANAKSLAGLGTNQIVAIDASLLAADADEWCGKEVAIFDSTGKRFQFSEGPLFVWDGCDACRTQSIVDLSAKAFVELKGGTCGGNNPGGLSFQVLDNNIWNPILKDGTGGGPASGANSPAPLPPAPRPTTQSPPLELPPLELPPATTTSKPPASNTKAISTVSVDILGGINKGIAAPPPPPPASTASAIPAVTTDATPKATGASTGCTYGAWQCHGLNIEVCNYVSTTALDWVTVSCCPSKCSITSTGSVNCQ